MRSVEAAFISGVMARSTRASGTITKCTDKVSCGGQTERNILETSRRIKDMVMESLNGEMAESTRESGSKASNMELESIEMQREKKGKVSGLRAREPNGCEISKNYFVLISLMLLSLTLTR